MNQARESFVRNYCILHVSLPFYQSCSLCVTLFFIDKKERKDTSRKEADDGYLQTSSPLFQMYVVMIKMH